mmetsp:Transcript_11255/g.15459  ORF Transcript_11255/g.15459 Transcript_11255/m.15459 type:complete len:341 (-) Transcript_11255:10-1032(-)
MMIDEAIYIVLDVSGEMSKRWQAEKVVPNRIEIAKNVLKNYIMQKEMLQQKQKWGIITLGNKNTDAVLELSEERDIILATLDSLTAENSEATEAADLNKISVALEHDSEWNLAKAKRILFIFGRSDLVPIGKIESTNFILDLIYLHAKPSEQNKCQEIYSFLTTLQPITNGGYFFETATSVQRLLQHCALLLAPPSLRDPQDAALAKFEWIKPQSYCDKVSSSMVEEEMNISKKITQNASAQRSAPSSATEATKSTPLHPVPTVAALITEPTVSAISSSSPTSSTSSLLDSPSTAIAAAAKELVPLPDPAHLIPSSSSTNSQTTTPSRKGDTGDDGRASV